MKNLTERAKEYSDLQWLPGGNNTIAQDGFENGALAERKRIVDLIESKIDLLSSEIESDCLSKLGVSNNEIRIKMLTMVLSKINEDE